MTLRLVVDDAIPWHREAFGSLGQLQPRPGRAIDNAVLRDADVLIVRSVTRVDPALLRGTQVRFVGSATAGEDHIDRAGLEAAGITVARAPGCNAQAVADYVVAALALARHARTGAPPGPVGVIGLGHVGRRTTRALRALGYHVLACDPPLADRQARALPIDDPDPSLANLARFERLVSLPELVESAVILTVHVPLHSGGDHPTAHLLDAEVLAGLRHGQLVINTCRGGVVDDEALEDWVTHSHTHALLDVWENEPTPRPGLLRGPGAARLATPHIAGYTLEGKVAATRMVHRALCRWLGRAPDFDGHAALGPVGGRPLHCDDPTAPHDWRPWVEAAVPLTPDDRRLRGLLVRPPQARAAGFEALRRGYALRRELSAFRIRDAPLDAATHGHLSALGIAVHGPPTLAAPLSQRG